MKLGAAIAIVGLLATAAAADPESDADAAFRAAQASATRGEPAALDALEALGRARPLTRWTDDAWAAAARLAEQRTDFARARRDLAEVVATTADDVTRRRAEAALARLAATTGAGGEWDAVVAEHDRLTGVILSGVGDPKPALAQLTALVAAHPTYPGATTARLVIAQGWERDGEPARGIAVLDEAIATAPTAELRGRARYAAVHARIHARDLGAARADLTAIASAPNADPMVVMQLEAALATAEQRARVRLAMWLVLALAAVVASWRARRDAGSWRAAGRAMLRPPVEVWYLAPVMAALVLVAESGNPMVARAIRAIALCGVGGAWLSGASLQLARAAGPLSARRVGAQVLVVVAALAGAAFLVVDRDRMIDLVAETWRSGPALP